MSEPQQVKQQQEAVGGRNQEEQDVSAIDTSKMGSNILNPMGGGLAEPAADIRPGEGRINDLPGDTSHLKNLAGDMGAVKGPGLGSVQGGIDARGGTGASDVAEQSKTDKLEGSSA
jgi:hypothetical protein